MKPTRRANGTQRIQRQILAGDAVRPSPDPWDVARGAVPLTPLQRNFLIVLLLLVIAGGVLAFLGHMLVATIPLFVLAIGLLVARFVF